MSFGVGAANDVVDEVADGADRVEDRGLGVDHLLPELAAGEPLHVGDPAAGDERRVPGEHLGVGVEQRQAAEEGVVREVGDALLRRGGDDLEQAAGREVVGGVLLDDALGAAGGAGGEHDPGVGGPGVLHAVGLAVGTGGHQLLERLVLEARVGAVLLAGLHHDDVLELGELALDEVQPVEVDVRDEELLGLDQVDGPAQEVALVGGVDGAHHRAGLEDAVPDGEELLAVRQHHGDGFTRLHPTGDQGVRDLVRPCVDLAVAHPRVVGELQVGPIRGLLRVVAKNLSQDPLGRVLLGVPVSPVGHMRSSGVCSGRFGARGGMVSSPREWWMKTYQVTRISCNGSHASAGGTCPRRSAPDGAAVPCRRPNVFVTAGNRGRVASISANGLR